MANIGTVLDQLVTDLSARPAFAEVNVFSGPIPVEHAGLECVAFGDTTLRGEEYAMAGSREENWEIHGEIYVSRAWQGSIEETIKAARDRALEILDDVRTYLAESYLGSYPDVTLTAGEMSQTYTDEARVCRVAFVLTTKIIA